MGTGAAIVLRIAFAVAIVYVLEVPFLKFTGALLLVWIASKLVMPASGEAGSHVGTQEATSLWQAVKIVAIADAVMSLDNVLSVAAAAKGSVTLLTFGIMISIPLMVVGSAMMLWLLDRVPLLAVAGAGLLGWIAGELAVHDPIAGPWIAMQVPWLPAVLPAIICIGIVAFGLLLRWKAARRSETATLREMTLPLMGSVGRRPRNSLRWETEAPARKGFWKHSLWVPAGRQGA